MLQGLYLHLLTLEIHKICNFPRGAPTFERDCIRAAASTFHFGVRSYEWHAALGHRRVCVLVWMRVDLTHAQEQALVLLDGAQASQEARYHDDGADGDDHVGGRERGE